VLVVTNWAGCSFGLLLSAFFPNLEVATSIAPVVLLPLMFLGGYFVNLDTVTWIFRWISFISPFNYGYKAFMQSILEGENYMCKIPVGGKEIDVPCEPLKTIGANLDLSEYLIILFSIGIGLSILACIALYVLSNPKT